MDDADLLERVAVDVIMIALRQSAERHRLAALGSAEVHVRRMGDALVAELTARLLGKRRTEKEITARESVPADWWQALRQRWLPTWWLRRWPVRTREIATQETREVWHVCPPTQT